MLVSRDLRYWQLLISQQKFPIFFFIKALTSVYLSPVNLPLPLLSFRLCIIDSHWIKSGIVSVKLFDKIVVPLLLKCSLDSFKCLSVMVLWSINSKFFALLFLDVFFHPVYCVSKWSWKEKWRLARGMTKSSYFELLRE